MGMPEIVEADPGEVGLCQQPFEGLGKRSGWSGSTSCWATTKPAASLLIPDCRFCSS